MNPKTPKSNQYDVIIIGAGIGGLVCGCYLSKQGLKTLILEQHSLAGGYCQSFKRAGFIFDAGVHGLGSCRETGQLGSLLKDLNCADEIKFIRKNPTELIISPDFTVGIRNELKETISDFQHVFPKEKNGVFSFFNFIGSIDINNMPSLISLYRNLKGKTFRDLLNHHFKDERIKAALTSVLGNIGLPASRASAIVASIFYREFILDGGYYPKGGMQNFIDALKKVFERSGGELILSQRVKEIKLINNQVNGVLIDNDAFIGSKYVVSNCDVRQTYLDLIKDQTFVSKSRKKLDKLIPSISSFIVYLGINKQPNVRFESCPNLWYLADYKIDRFFETVYKGYLGNQSGHVFCSRPTIYDEHLAPNNKEILKLMVIAPYKSKEFWKKHRFSYSENIIRRAEKLFPALKTNIVAREIGTPYTFYRYTLNYRGAMCGWASLPSQVESISVPQKSSIKNLFLAGHWVTQVGQGGLPAAVYSGKKAARLILESKPKTN